MLLIMLKGYECVQSLLGAYVTMNENINWTAELVSDGAFFLMIRSSVFFSVSCSLQAKGVVNIRHRWRF